MMERLRRRRPELLEQGDPDERAGRVGERLDEVVAEERAAIDELEEEARASGDERRRQVTDDVAAERRIALDLLPGDLAGRVRALQHYEFVSSEAREQFEELVEELREEVADTYFEGMSEALGSVDPEQLARMRDAFDALNRMLEQRERGEPIDPTFEEFMEHFGDLFPGADSLDELLEQLAARMAAAEAMWHSLSPEQRDQLRSLADSLFEDMDLRWQMERLSANLQRAFPDAGWGQGYRFTGEGPMGSSEATDMAAQLGELDRMEELLQSASSPAALSEIDLDQVRRHLGEDAAAVARPAGPAGQGAGRGGAHREPGRPHRAHPQGRAPARASGPSRTCSPRWRRTASATTRPPGRAPATTGRRPPSPTSTATRSTCTWPRPCTTRCAGAGPGCRSAWRRRTSRSSRPRRSTRSATVLLVDLSMSMPMRDNFVPAKKMAMALHTLISSRFPRDYLGIVGFSEVAREIKPEELPTAMWDYVYGTNLQHALLLARTLLAHQHGTKQIIVVTDGEPTAHIEPDGEVFFNYPPMPETLRRTMAEVVRCTRAGITINIFALDLERTQFPFVEQIARVNGGRTFYTTPDALGGYVLVDFLQHRRVLRRPAG